MPLSPEDFPEYESCLQSFSLPFCFYICLVFGLFVSLFASLNVLACVILLVLSLICVWLLLNPSFACYACVSLFSLLSKDTMRGLSLLRISSKRSELKSS